MIEKNWQELIKPNKIEIKEDNSGKNVSRLTVEPLEKGFGLTIGNSLRRILLSSLQGSKSLQSKLMEFYMNFQQYQELERT